MGLPSPESLPTGGQASSYSVDSGVTELSFLQAGVACTGFLLCLEILERKRSCVPSLILSCIPVFLFKTAGSQHVVSVAILKHDSYFCVSGIKMNLELDTHPGPLKKDPAS